MKVRKNNMHMVDEDKKYIEMLYESCQEGVITEEQRESLIADYKLDLRMHQIEEELETSLTLESTDDTHESAKEVYDKIRKMIYEKCAAGEFNESVREELLVKARTILEKTDDNKSGDPVKDFFDASKAEADAKALEANVENTFKNLQKPNAKAPTQNPTVLKEYTNGPAFAPGSNVTAGKAMLARNTRTPVSSGPAFAPGSNVNAGKAWLSNNTRTPVSNAKPLPLGVTGSSTATPSAASSARTAYSQRDQNAMKAAAAANSSAAKASAGGIGLQSGAVSLGQLNTQPAPQPKSMTSSISQAEAMKTSNAQIASKNASTNSISQNIAVDQSIDNIARDVIRGKYGNGPARQQALKAAGYDYDTVQKRVNELMK